EMIRCDELIRFIEDHQDEYAYVYIPYMFTTTYRGVLAAPQRAVLIPCLHDESYAYLGIYKPVFEQPRGIMFNTPPPMALDNDLRLLGTGVDTQVVADGDRFRKKYRLDRFLLYAGRKDAGKNVPLLIDYFCRYKEIYPGELKLVLIGDGTVAVPAKHAQSIV